MRISTQNIACSQRHMHRCIYHSVTHYDKRQTDRQTDRQTYKRREINRLAPDLSLLIFLLLDLMLLLLFFLFYLPPVFGLVDQVLLLWTVAGLVHRRSLLVDDKYESYVHRF